VLNRLNLIIDNHIGIPEIFGCHTLFTDIGFSNLKDGRYIIKIDKNTFSFLPENTILIDFVSDIISSFQSINYKNIILSIHMPTSYFRYRQDIRQEFIDKYKNDPLVNIFYLYEDIDKYKVKRDMISFGSEKMEISKFCDIITLDDNIKNIIK